MQKAIIVNTDESDEHNVSILNKYLANGWKVINMCGMPSASYGGSFSSSFKPHCLVIIEKIDKI